MNKVKIELTKEQADVAYMALALYENDCRQDANEARGEYVELYEKKAQLAGESAVKIQKAIHSQYKAK